MTFPEITLTHKQATASIAPERGALVTALRVNSHELLYLDRYTFEDPSRNVRGGIPILFPFAGKLTENRFLPDETEIPQHGFGRNKPWRISGQGSDWLSCALSDDEATRAVYPYPFLAEQTCQVLARGLEIVLRVTNTGARPMPLAPGWHPYFNCPGPKKTQVHSDDVPTIDPRDFSNEREFELGADAPASGRAEFALPALGRVALSASPEMRHLHFWSLPGRDFICLEPFTGPLDAINRPEQRVDLAAGETCEFWMKIELL